MDLDDLIVLDYEGAWNESFPLQPSESQPQPSTTIQHSSTPTLPAKASEQEEAAENKTKIHRITSAPEKQQQQRDSCHDDYSNRPRRRRQRHQHHPPPHRERNENYKQVSMSSSRNIIHNDRHHRDRRDKSYWDDKDRRDRNYFHSRRVHTPARIGRDRVREDHREDHTSRHDGRNKKRSKSTSPSPSKSSSRWRDDRDERKRPDLYSSSYRRTTTTLDNQHQIEPKRATSYTRNDHQVSRLSSPSLPSTNTLSNPSQPPTGSRPPSDTLSHQPPESTTTATDAAHVPCFEEVSSFGTSECHPSPPHMEHPAELTSPTASSTVSASASASATAKASATEPLIQTQHVQESSTASIISLQTKIHTADIAPLSVIPSHGSLSYSPSSVSSSPAPPSPPPLPSSCNNLVVQSSSTSVSRASPAPPSLSVEQHKPRQKRKRQSQVMMPISSNETLTLAREQSHPPEKQQSLPLRKRPRQHQRTLADLHPDGLARGHYEIVSTAPRMPIVSFEDPTVIVESSEQAGPVPTQHQQGEGLSIDNNYVGLHYPMMHKVRFHMAIKMFGALHQAVKSKPYKYHSCTCRYLNSLFHDAARIKSHIKSMLKNSLGTTDAGALPLSLPLPPIEHNELFIHDPSS